MEVHVVGYAGDLYGRVMDVEVLDWVREQWRFPNIDALKARLTADIAHVARRSELAASEPIV